MKKIISLTLAALMLVTLLLTVTSCEVSMEPMTGYTRLRDHIKATDAEKKTVKLDGKSVGLMDAAVSVFVDDEGKETVVLYGYKALSSAGQVVQVSIHMDGSTEKAQLLYEVYQATGNQRLAAATAPVLLTHYTGNEPVAFDEVEGITVGYFADHAQNATNMLNQLFLILDTYMTAAMDMNLRELGFIALSDTYMAPAESAEAEEDLGGAFSPARLSMAGLMIVQGVGMVFLVLAILWLVLLIFKKIFYKEPKKAAEKTETPAPVAALVSTPAPVATDDGQLVAAITAAVAAYIDSDPALSSQFAGGFRVVSFKKKNGKTSWNH